MSIPAWRLRALRPLDIPAAARIHKDAFGFEAWDERSLGEVMAMPRARGLIAVDAALGDRRALGFALFLVVAEDAELLTIAVRRESRRVGLGTALMEGFFACGIAAGATQALLEVADDNIQAQRLYRRLGFDEQGRRADYYRRPGNKHVGARLLRRALVSTSGIQSQD